MRKQAAVPVLAICGDCCSVKEHGGTKLLQTGQKFLRNPHSTLSDISSKFMVVATAARPVSLSLS